MGIGDVDSRVSPRVSLQEEFNRRKARNRSYSLRAFARTLGLPPGRLSEIFSDKRPLTPKLGEKISASLGLSPDSKKRFLEKVKEARTERSSWRKIEQGSAEAPASIHSDFEQLSEDSFRVLADWYHFAVFVLIETDDFDPSISWIAKRLGISTIEARSGIERLARLGLIEEKRKTWVTTRKNLTTSHEVSSSALKHSHRQDLERAILSLEEVPIQLRDITSVTMSIDPAKLPEAKKMITSFRRKLCKYLESGKKKEVYNLNLQLIPISKRPSKEGRSI